MKAIVLALCCVLGVATLASARTLTVDSQGGAEFQSVQAAIDSANAGDKVEVAAGSYAENINMKSGVDVIGAGATQTTLVGTTLPGSSVVRFENVTHAKLAGFTITSDTAPFGLGVKAVTFVGPETGPTAVLERCLLTGTQYGIFVWSPSTPTLLNNTLAGGGLNEQGIYIGNGPSAPVVRNNIITGYDDGIRVVAGESEPTPVIAYNAVWGNATNYVNYPDQTGVNGNISVDPLFVDADSFRLQAGSPAIDAGDPNSPLDPDGTRVDMGALPFSFLQGT